MIETIAAKIGTPLGLKIAAGVLGAAFIAGGTYHVVSVSNARKEGQAQGKIDGLKEAEAANKVKWEAEQKAHEAEHVALNAESETLAAERRSLDLARAGMRAELQRNLGALATQLRGANVQIQSIPADDLDDALRAALRELRARDAAKAAALGGGKAGAPGPTP